MSISLTLVTDRRYSYDERGLLVKSEYTRDGHNFRWELAYDDVGNLLSNVLTLNRDEESYQGNLYSYEENRLVWREVYRESQVISSRAYVYEEGRLNLSKDPDTGWYTYFRWTEEATACSFLRAWHLLFLHPDLGDTSQEMLTRLFGHGGPTGLFF